MKLIIPKQHGAWGMLLIPFVLGVLIGKGTWYHIPLFLAWLFVYLATYRFVSWGYHSLLVIATLLVSPWFTIAFIPSLMRSILFYGRNISILKVGILESINSI